MRKRFARNLGILSISTILAAVVTVSTAATTGGSALAETTPTVTFAPVSQPLQAKVATATVTTQKPKAKPKRHREFRAAFSKDAKDKKGYEKSLYRGKYYHADQENWRKCVMDRESNFSYYSQNGSSSAAGAYQFLDNSWRDGLVHMMIKESKKTGDDLVKKAKTHFDRPINEWNRYWQDRAFFTALNYNGKWSGKKHWNPTVPGTGC